MMAMGRKIILATALAATAGLGSVAIAQEPVSALRGLNSNAPVDISSDRIEVQERADRAIFAGNVVARQDQLTLETARLTVAYSTAGGIDIDRLDAAGGVVVRSPSETARGNFGIYDLDRKLITLIGDVQLTREGNQVNGQRLVIDLNTGRAVIDGGAPGVAQSGGRVTGRFTVPQRRNGS
jgi:lipopolysaccharide export system protein LptA